MSKTELMITYRSEAARAGISSPCRQTEHLNDVRTGWTFALAGGASA
jgi:hypothetical protein